MASVCRIGVFLSLLLLGASGCCYGPGLKREASREWRREVNTTRQLPDDVMAAVRGIWSPVPELVHEVRREGKREWNAPRGILEDFKALDCPPE